MKKKILFLLIMLLIPFSAFAEELTYAEAQEAVKQTIQAWYMRGPVRQYNTARNSYDLRHPEDATIYDMGYSVCSGFTNDVWTEAFGMKAVNDNVAGGNTPAGSESYCTEAQQYVKEKACTSSDPSKAGCKGEFVIYSYKKGDASDYIYSPKSNTDYKAFENLLTILQPGDIFAFNGHVLILYDFKTNSSGKRTDALLFESGSRSLKTVSRIASDSYYQLFYYKKTNSEKNGLLDLNSDTFQKFEGTVKWRWLSSYTVFIKNNKLDCTGKNTCSITRAYYKNGDKAAFNYNITWSQQINTSKARVEMPGLYLQKTSSKTDNDSVALEENITYYLNVVNNSNLAKGKSTKYTNIHVEETLPLEVEFVASKDGSSPEGTYNESTRTIKWDIDSIEAGSKVVIKYKVKVKKEAGIIGRVFEQNGKIYKSSASNYIPTGTIRHEVINSTSKTDEEYLAWYNKAVKDGKTGVELIQAVYKGVYGDEDLGFTFSGFNKDKLLSIVYRPDNPSMTFARAIQLKNSGENAIFAEMILNNYWGGTVSTTYKNANESSPEPIYFLPNWKGTDTGDSIGSSKRAKTIIDGQFQSGDVLLYYIDHTNTKESLRFTKEDGFYAFIYIDGKFVGVNYKGKSNERNSFTVDYYDEKGIDKATNLYTGPSSYYEFANWQSLMGKDAFLILRPEKVITEVKSITVQTNPTKTTYYQNQSLDITGGVIKATYNDGTTKTINMNDTGVKVSGYNPGKIGEQNITVTYKGKTTTFKVTVNENAVTSFTIGKNPTKTNYFVGDAFDGAGGYLDVVYASGERSVISFIANGVAISGFDSTTAGTKTITVTYKQKSATFQVTIVEVQVTSLVIQQDPNKLVYGVGELLDLSGGVLLEKYNNNTKRTVSMTDLSVQVGSYDFSMTGLKGITLTLDGKSVTFEVIVEEAQPGQLTLYSISVHKAPFKTTYNIGEELDLTWGYIKADYRGQDGNTVYNRMHIIGMKDNMFTYSGFDSTTEGTKTITVTAGDKTTSFTVNVVKPTPVLKSISVTKTPSKTEYLQYEENLNNAGGELTLTYSDGTTETIPLTNANIAVLDNDNTTLGSNQIVVQYNGLETTYNVDIVESEPDAEDDDSEGTIDSIEVIQQPNKTTYIQNVEAFDASGIILKVHYSSGSIEEYDLVDYPGLYTISGYDNSKVGEQLVTLTFKGTPVVFRINVVSNGTDIVSPNTLKFRSRVSTVLAFLLITIGAGLMIRTSHKKQAVRS